MTSRDPGALAAMIDHTLLKPDAVRADLLRFCEEARTHRFRSVCVNPDRVRLVADALAGSDVRACSVVGFPLGASTPAIKAEETRAAIGDGAAEIDMVLAIGRMREGDLDHVRRDVAAVRAACPGAVLKVIIETCLLDEGEKREACRIAAGEGADFLKTSTGFSTGGATLEDIRLMREVLGPELGIKASGGVRSTDAAWALVEAGATRIGTSSGLALIGAGGAVSSY